MFWNNQCIVDAYFNQHHHSTEDERKLKDRLRKKKFQQRMSSVHRDQKVSVLTGAQVEPKVDQSDDTANPRWQSVKEISLGMHTTREKL